MRTKTFWLFLIIKYNKFEFCMQPPHTILTTTQHSLTLVLSGGGGHQPPPPPQGNPPQIFFFYKKIFSDKLQQPNTISTLQFSEPHDFHK